MSISIDYPKTTKVTAVCSGCRREKECWFSGHLERNEAIVFFCENENWRIDSPWENGQKTFDIFCVKCQEKAAQIPLFSALQKQQ